MSKDLASLKEMLYNKIKLTDEFINESPPDWLNPHDFSSGFYKGNKESAKLTKELLIDILDTLEKL